jgi:excisionase family DNA binding protein
MNHAPSAPDERLTYSIEEAGQLLGISRGLAYQLANSGGLPTLRLGRRLVIPKAALQKMIEGGARPLAASA